MAEWSAKDIHYMDRALALARRGSGYVAPNPMVGALLVNDGKVVGKGWHRKVGGAHAEIEAIKDAGDAARGATLYVTLEPCNHFGRTGPCTTAILDAGITRVVAATRDPNPGVDGGGVQELKSKGLQVDVGCFEHRAIELNIMWHHWVRHKTPFVLLKLAASLDGKIAIPGAVEPWLSGVIARKQVHRLRKHFDAVMVGSGTVDADNPRLTNRSGSGMHPLRVVIDSDLSIPVSANVYQQESDSVQLSKLKTITFTTSKADYDRRSRLELQGVEVVVAESSDGVVDLEAVFFELGQRGVQGVLCEGGAGLATSLISSRLCHRLLLYHAPICVGSRGVGMFNDNAAPVAFKLLWSKRVGEDICSMYELGKSM